MIPSLAWEEVFLMFILKGTRGLTSPKEGVILETARSCPSRTRYERGCWCSI